MCFRLLLVCLLATDLVGSPLHLHRHEGELSLAGPAAGVTHLLSHHASEPTHAEAPDAQGFSHSILALRTVAHEVEAARTSLTAVTLWPAIQPTLRAVQDVVARSRDFEPWAFTTYRSLPPAGRAPPQDA